MITNRSTISRAPSMALGLAVTLMASIAAQPATAQTAPPKPAAKAHAPAHTAAKAPVKKGVPAKVEYVPAEPASPEQIDAAERVYYGVYDCEFKQTIDITKNLKFPAFVDVKLGKVVYLMKPVLSSTGAVRLEDIRGETLMVQISSKSMLLNVKTAHRLVDDCVSPRQRDLINAAREAKATAAAAAEAALAASASAASAPTAAPIAPAEVPSAMTSASQPLQAK